jgi:stage II sporulation protein D
MLTTGADARTRQRAATQPRRGSAATSALVTLALVVGLIGLQTGEARAETRTHAPSVKLVAESPDTIFTIPGYGRYADTVELVPAPDGRLQVINESDMDTYVEGLAEMPVSWPMEALKAQAVTARTYAWYSIALGTFAQRGLDFDICATVDCQVFAGRKYVEASGGERWAQAVAETAGETLLWEGRPILARFFSSSGGHTRDNEHVYGNKSPEGPRPYLKGIPDPDEAISPHHRWRWEMKHSDLDRLLSRGQTLSAAVPVQSIERVESDGSRVDQIRVVGEDGTEVEVSASKFRAWVSQVAPRVLPNRWPIRDVNGRAMPDGMPSSRIDFCLTCKDGIVVIEGKGWGHGVGMSQWGARGKAERGMEHDDILAEYYQGLRPATSPHLPDRVRAGLSWESRGVTVEPSGPYRLIVGDRSAWRGGGDSWRIDARDRGSVTLSGPSTGWEPYEEPPPPPPAPEPTEVPADVPDAEVDEAPDGVSRVPSARTDDDGETVVETRARETITERVGSLNPLVGPAGARLLFELFRGRD